MCDIKTEWQRCVEFHGHECPGLAIGYRASLAAREKLILCNKERQTNLTQYSKKQRFFWFHT